MPSRRRASVVLPAAPSSAGVGLGPPAMSHYPLLRHARLDAIFARRAGVPIAVEDFLLDVAALSRVLPHHHHVVNLCADRYRFAVGLAAALQPAWAVDAAAAEHGSSSTGAAYRRSGGRLLSDGRAAAGRLGAGLRLSRRSRAQCGRCRDPEHRRRCARSRAFHFRLDRTSSGPWAKLGCARAERASRRRPARNRRN